MLKKHHVLITGTSTGIGHAAALHLDRLGFYVIAGVRKQADADHLKALASDRLATIMLDVTDKQMIADAAQQVDALTGDNGLYGLVNNAGAAAPGPLEFLPIDQLRWQLEVNVIGQIAVTQAMMPMIRRATGRIINISSIAGRVSVKFGGAYAASKHAMEALTDALRREVQPWNIEVISILPGVIDTPIWETTRQRSLDVLEDAPQAFYDYYGSIAKAAAERLHERRSRGIPPQAVAKAIEHALTATRPRTRYLVGNDARLLSWIRWLPDRVLDRILTR